MEINNIIDISQWNGTINWDALAPYINGAIIRCGFGMDQYNQDDWQYARNVSEAERLGIPYDIYFYSYSRGDSTGSEIQHTLRLLDGHHPGHIWLDLEERSCASYFRQVAIEYCEAMEAHGYMPGIYSGQEFWGGILAGLDRWPKWIPAYGSNVGGQMYMWAKPTIGIPYVGWQYTSTAAFTGIVGNVDNSVWYEPFGVQTVSTPTTPHTGSVTGSTLELAEQVMLGRFGVLDARKAALGNRYDEVQGFIDHIYKAPSYDLAQEVLTGKYGNDEVRRHVLGDRWSEVQEIVDHIVLGDKRQADQTYYYTVQPGDTVSGIANSMGVNWLEIARLNGLEPPYTIYVGQKLKIN